MLVYSSTQHPSELQNIVAHMLNLPAAAVNVEVRRMGGAFGGKELQAAQWAAMAALAARITGRPCKMRLDRDDDMAMTGKRHDFRADYTAGFDRDGAITAFDVSLASRCGYSADLSVVDQRSRHVPRRQRLLPAGDAHRHQADQDAHRLEHRVPRFWRAARHDGGRAADRRHRLDARPRSARRAQAQSLWRGPRSSRPTACAYRQHPARDDRDAGAHVATTARGRRDSRRSTRTSAFLKRGHRAHAGQVRHLVHHHAISTKPARWCMSIRTVRCT